MTPHDIKKTLAFISKVSQEMTIGTFNQLYGLTNGKIYWEEYRSLDFSLDQLVSVLAPEDEIKLYKYLSEKFNENG